MTNINPNDFPGPEFGESDEQYVHRIQEVALGINWQLRFQAHFAEGAALKHVLKDENDPNKVVDLVEQRNKSKIKALGAFGLTVWKDGVLAERQQFDDEFGHLAE